MKEAKKVNLVCPTRFLSLDTIKSGGKGHGGELKTAGAEVAETG